jgi:hypothetical protein
MFEKSKVQIAEFSFRWLARLTSLVTLAIVAMFLFAEPFNPKNVRPREWVGFVCFPIGVVLGLIIAWWKEGPGAAISLCSLAAFYLIYGWLMGSNIHGPWFLIFASPAFLFSIAWLLSKSKFSEVHA